MAEHEFRVTVEDLTTGDRRVMEFAAGDYVLVPFAPCRRASVDVSPQTGTHVITVKGHRPAVPARVVREGTPPPALDRTATMRADAIRSGHCPDCYLVGCFTLAGDCLTHHTTPKGSQ